MIDETELKQESIVGYLLYMYAQNRRDGAEVVEIVRELEALNKRLLEEGSEEYRKVYYESLPYIVELRSKAGGKPKGEIETCLDAVCLVLMLYGTKREVSEATTEATGKIVAFLNALSREYRKG